MKDKTCHWQATNKTIWGSVLVLLWLLPMNANPCWMSNSLGNQSYHFEKYIDMGIDPLGEAKAGFVNIIKTGRELGEFNPRKNAGYFKQEARVCQI